MVLDPFTAVGLAGNIVQFVDFTSKLLSGALTLYHGGVEHEKTKFLITEITTLAQNTRPPDIPGKALEGHDLFLKSLSDQCIALSEELLSSIGGLRATKQHKIWESLYRTLQTEWKRKGITALQQELYQTSSRLRAWDMDSRQLDLDRRVNELAVQNEKLHGNSAQELRDMKNEIHLVFRQFKTASENDIENTKLWLQLGGIAQQGNRLGMEQFVLMQLHFESMHDRFETVQDAHAKTFSWMLDPPILQSSRNTTIRRQPNFSEWLTSSESSLYWISGNPGSGKSTLMKYLHKDVRTLAGLKAWSGHSTLVVAEFYFWNASKHLLPKSQEGLLRSILYQILQQCPELIQRTFPQQFPSSDLLIEDVKSAFASSSFLSIRELLAAFERLTQAIATDPAIKVKFCFLIDGLDEFDGNPQHIVRFLRMFRESRDIKLCVSSRPWNEFEVPFGLQNTWKLYVHEWTRNDISTYVKDHFEEHPHFLSLKATDARYLLFIEDIVNSAQGVFLWVRLVVQSLLDGLTNMDRIEDLEQRFAALPTDLDEYFEKMLFDVDPFYRKQAARMCLVTLHADDFLPAMLYWFIDHSDDFPRLIDPALPTDEDVQHRRIEQMKIRLNTLGRCLLQCQPPRSTSAHDSVANILFSWDVHFLHRTVIDFLQTPKIFGSLKQWAGQDFNADLAIADAILLQVRTSNHDRSFFHKDRYQKLVAVFLNHMGGLEMVGSLKVHVRRLRDRFRNHIKASTSYAQDDWHSVFATQALFGCIDRPGVQPMLAIAAERGLFSYVTIKIEKASSSHWASAGYLLESVLTSSRFQSSSEKLKMLRYFLLKGISPNAAVLGYPGTCWSRYLQYVQGTNRNATDIDFDMMREIIEHGADLNIICFGAMKASDVLKARLSADQLEAVKLLRERPRPSLKQRPKIGRRERMYAWLRKLFGR